MTIPPSNYQLVIASFNKFIYTLDATLIRHCIDYENYFLHFPLIIICLGRISSVIQYT